ASDSFNSTNALYSTNGKYDPDLALDHGDIATNSGLADSLKAGNANIKGKISTGPGGIADVGSNGTVGDKSWVKNGNLGIQTGHFSDDMNLEFPEVELPSDTPQTVYAGNYPDDLGLTNYTYLLTGKPIGETPWYL